MTAVRMVRVGDVLQQVRRTTPVSAAETYPMVGARNFARGSFDAGSLRGTDTKYRELQLVKAGDLIYPKLGAWEGAFSFVGPGLGDRYTSPEYCVFTMCSTEVDAAYLRHLFAWEAFWRSLAARSTGTNVRRRRLQPDAFLEGRLPLPDVVDQQRIAGHLDRLAHVALAVSSRSTTTYSSALAAIDLTVERLHMSAGFQAPLGNVAEVNPRRVRVEREQVAFVPMAAVDEVTGAIASPQMRSTEEVTKGYTQFRRGDVIFARITPCMQNGKSAIFDEPGSEFGFGSTEFHVVRPRRGGPPATWLHAVFRSHWFKKAAQEKFSGTAGQQRVSSTAFKELRVPVPTGTRATELLGRLDRLEASRHCLQTMVAERRGVAAALLPAARNEAFADLT